ncbi:MAG: hypothetical protein ABR953_07535 [Candidatus Acidiferrales bacterium]|jgi:hypothetical protein
MKERSESNFAAPSGNPRELEPAAGGESPSLKDSSLVLSLLEADQVVAAKRQTRFGRRNLSFGVQILLWGLRIYVVAMLVIVLISVLRAIHVSP